jgi:hypothetical protein
MRGDEKEQSNAGKNALPYILDALCREEKL